MKFYEICFSPTGGTKKAADMLAEKLAEEIQSVDLTDYKTDFSGISLEEDDEAIIAVPSYGGRVPETAVKRLSLIKGNQAKAMSVSMATGPMKTLLWNWKIQPKPQDSGSQPQLPL